MLEQLALWGNMGKAGLILICALGWMLARPAHAQFNDMSCITVSQLKNTDTPPRLARSVRDCVAQERYADAMQVFLAYSVYGTFDQQRVRDVSGHAAFVELNSWVFGGYQRDTVDELKTVSARLRAGGDFFQDTCKAIRRAGWPNYRPTYMIERGIMPRKSQDDWEQAGFVAAAAWEKALVDVNGCPAG
ncbi:MAG: hypothetical protein V3U96_07940 [Paracoccaceae bacterium]